MTAPGEPVQEVREPGAARWPATFPGAGLSVLWSARTLRIALRTVHIGAAGVTLGAATFGHPAEAWAIVLLASGFGIVLSDVLKHGWDWLRYVQGQAVLLKLALVAVGVAWPPALLACLWVALVIGSIVSHAPGSVRHYALLGPPGPCARPSCDRHAAPRDDARRAQRP